MNFDYQIAGCLWRFCTEVPLIDSGESKKFRDYQEKPAADWICNLKTVKDLPKPQGEPVIISKEQRIYLDDGYLWLELLSRENEDAYFLAKYPWDCDEEVQLWILNEMRPYTVRMEHIWSAIDFPYQLLKKDILTLHSAVIKYKEEAILFLAPSCTGKSTQAKLWENFRGAVQVNGDKAGIYCTDHEVKACGLPFCGTSSICEKYELPVKALVILTQAKENSVTRLKGAKAFTEILSNCFGHQEIPRCREKIFVLLLKILTSVPVYLLSCTPDVRAVEALEAYLQEE